MVNLVRNCVLLGFQLMLDSWNSSIFSNIKQRLQDSAMKLVHAERNGEAFDSQLVIGVRESYGKSVHIRLSGKFQQIEVRPLLVHAQLVRSNLQCSR